VRFWKIQAASIRAALYLVLTVGAIVAMIPFGWMVLTSFKTYGEHSLRELWPKALTPIPYQGLPPGETIHVDLRPAERWGGAPKSFSPLMEGTIRLEKFSPIVEEELQQAGVSLPLELLILAADSTDDGVENYDYFALSIGTRVLGQNTVKFRLDEWAAPYYIEVPDMERWGPHFRVVNNRSNDFTVRMSWRPEHMFPFNYIKAWKEAHFGLYMHNSVIITGITVLGVLVFCIPAAYAFARMNFPGKGLIFMLYLATIMIPAAVILIPNFLIVVELDRFFETKLGLEEAWMNNWTALTIPFFVNTFSVFLLRQFFAQIPDELFDTALIDGCGHLRFLIQVVLPLSKAPLMSVIIFNGIWSWNSFQWPLIVTNTPKWRPITVGLSGFINEAAAEVHLMMAGAAITLIPVLILYFFTQKQFTEGIATTGLKG